jgi:hypothetical protein
MPTHIDGCRATYSNVIGGCEEFTMKSFLLRSLAAATIAAGLTASAAAQEMPVGEMAYGGEGCSDGMCGDCYGGDCYGGCYGGDCYGGCPCGDPQCGGCGCGYGDCGQCGYNSCGCNDGCEKHCACYFEIQNVFVRPHINEDVVGKLSETYDWSPRFIAGFELPSGVGARGRYWNYDQEVPILSGGDDLGLKWQVIDVEGTGRIRSTHADLVFSGGFRFADIEIEEDDDTITSSMIGLTVAADGRTVLCRGCSSEWAGVAGARWSLLGGDWEGDSNDIVSEVRDDNMVVTELYGGVEYSKCCGSCTVYTRAVFEMQNWHSDAIGENSATDTIGFVGPAIHGGVSF